MDRLFWDWWAQARLDLTVPECRDQRQALFRIHPSNNWKMVLSRSQLRTFLFVATTKNINYNVSI